MKPILGVVVASLLAFAVSAQESRFYAFGGMTNYSEELVAFLDPDGSVATDSTGATIHFAILSGGIGAKAGVGVAINEYFSFEAMFDTTPEPDFSKALGVNLEADGKSCYSAMLVGEFDTAFSNSVSFVGKAGYTRCGQEDEDYGAPRASVGLKIPFLGNASMLFSFEQVFDEVNNEKPQGLDNLSTKTVSFGATLRFDF